MAKGTYIAAIALVHLLAGLLYKDEIAAIFRDAIVDSVPDFGDRAAAFWFSRSACCWSCSDSPPREPPNGLARRIRIAAVPGRGPRVTVKIYNEPADS
jgi:hypothetical protein